MYLDYFRLRRLPFSIAPDPDLLYLSSAHQEALAHLNYALTGHGGLICLTGEVGMGKTTLCRAFIDQAPDHVDIAYIFNPVLSSTELLQAICQELSIPCRDSNEDLLQSNKQLFDALYHGLISRYSQGRKVICIIDEAQSMPASLLEQIRLLTNLETNKDKLLTLILVGQPELKETLSQHKIRQFDQRITARYHLKSMELEQLKPYLKHRLKQAGCDDELFEDNAVQYIWNSAKGIPRLINSIADRALLGAYATDSKKVTKTIAAQAAIEVLGGSATALERTIAPFKTKKMGIMLVLLPMIFLIGLLLTQNSELPKFEEVAVSMTHMSKNQYELLADANGLSSNDNDFSSCERIASNSVQKCLSLNWPLSDLKRLQRPIAVFDGEQWKVVPSESIEKRPLENFILWQPMPGYENEFVRPIRPSESHPIILWVRGRLKSHSLAVQADIDDSVVDQSTWQIISPSGDEGLRFNNFYDPLLAEQIGSFQSKMGLDPDQIIGLKTLLALQNLPAETQ